MNESFQSCRAANESFQSCRAADEEQLEGHDDTIPMEIDITDEDEKENVVNTIPPAEAAAGKRRKGDTSAGSIKTVIARNKKPTDSKKKLALKLVCTEGPHEGESIRVEDTVTIGQNPRAKLHYKLGNDGAASATHAKIVLNKSGGGKGKKWFFRC